MASIEPELWVERARDAIAFYEDAFGATVLHVSATATISSPSWPWGRPVIGSRQLSPVRDEHGWRLGRIEDPAGHEWEIGHPLGIWPPSNTQARRLPSKLRAGTARRAD